MRGGTQVSWTENNKHYYGTTSREKNIDHGEMEATVACHRTKHNTSNKGDKPNNCRMKMKVRVRNRDKANESYYSLENWYVHNVIVSEHTQIQSSDEELTAQLINSTGCEVHVDSKDMKRNQTEIVNTSIQEGRSIVSDLRFKKNSTEEEFADDQLKLNANAKYKASRGAHRALKHRKLLEKTKWPAAVNKINGTLLFDPNRNLSDLIGEGENELIPLANDDMLEQLRTCDSIVCDATFKIAKPHSAYQMYMMSTAIKSKNRENYMMFPLLIVFMKDKMRPTYTFMVTSTGAESLHAEIGFLVRKKNNSYFNSCSNIYEFLSRKIANKVSLLKGEHRQREKKELRIQWAIQSRCCRDLFKLLPIHVKDSRYSKYMDKFEELCIKGGNARDEAARIVKLNEKDYAEWLYFHTESVPEHKTFLETGSDQNVEIVFKTRKRPNYAKQNDDDGKSKKSLKLSINKQK